VLIKSAYPWVDEVSGPASLAQMLLNNPDAQGRPRPSQKLCAGQTLLCKALGLKVPMWDAKRFDHELLLVEDTGPAPTQIIQTTRLGIPPGPRRTPDVPLRRRRVCAHGARGTRCAGVRSKVAIISCCKRNPAELPSACNREIQRCSLRQPSQGSSMVWSFFMGPWLDSVTGWLAANPQWLAAAVFIVAFVECLAIAGLIVPGTVLLFAVAVLAGSGALSLSETLLLGFLGGFWATCPISWAGISTRTSAACRVAPPPGMDGRGRNLLPALRHRQPAGRALHRPAAADAADGRRDVRHALPALLRRQPAGGGRLVGRLPAAGLGHRRGDPLAAAGRFLAAGRHRRRQYRSDGRPERQQQLAPHRKATIWISSMSLLILIGLFIGYPYLHALDQG
jgi:hypothetical protein